MAYRGSLAVLKMNDSNNEATSTTLTAEGNGCSAITFSKTNPSRDVPSYDPHMRRESLERSDVSGSFDIDATDTTVPLFRAVSGKRRYFWYFPEGNTTGMPKEAFEAYVDVTINAPANKAIRFGVTLSGDSEVTKTTV